MTKKKIFHELRYSGWSSDPSKCGYAGWWDCSFICSKTKKKLYACPMRIPDYSKCEFKNLKGKKK